MSSHQQERKIVRKKKKFGKIYEFTPVVRDVLPNEEEISAIETLIKKEKLLTPQYVAEKTNVTVSAAKRMLDKAVQEGKLEVLSKNKYTTAYVKK